MSNSKKRVIDYNFGIHFKDALETSSLDLIKYPFGEKLTSSELRESMDMILLSERADWGLHILARTGVIETILPEVYALIDFGDGIKHKNVWLHTLQVLIQSKKKINLRWAALFHDIGKVPTRRFEPGNQVTFTGHPEVGARMFDSISGRIPFTEDEKNSIRFLISSHLRGSAYNETWTDSAVRRFITDASVNLEDSLDLARADITSKYTEKVIAGLSQINLLAEHIKRVAKNDLVPSALPKGLGDEIVKNFNIIKGPKLGKIMNILKQDVEEGKIEYNSTCEDLINIINKNQARYL
jgi:poly(A) polymerase